MIFAMTFSTDLEAFRTGYKSVYITGGFLVAQGILSKEKQP
jgi:hypothetical protein